MTEVHRAEKKSQMLTLPEPLVDLKANVTYRILTVPERRILTSAGKPLLTLSCVYTAIHHRIPSQLDHEVTEAGNDVFCIAASPVPTVSTQRFAIFYWTERV